MWAWLFSRYFFWVGSLKYQITYKYDFNLCFSWDYYFREITVKLTREQAPAKRDIPVSVILHLETSTTVNSLHPNCLTELCTLSPSPVSLSGLSREKALILPPKAFRPASVILQFETQRVLRSEQYFANKAKALSVNCYNHKRIS